MKKLRIITLTIKFFQILLSLYFTFIFILYDGNIKISKGEENEKNIFNNISSCNGSSI
ncbi:hypothetical protein DSECCO2_485380 [anaerobic digester metagenome]